MTKPQISANVWDVLSDTPEDAAIMSVRSRLMIALSDKVRAWGLTQRAAARRLGITQPRLNDLLQGRIHKFSIEALMGLLPRAGLKIKVDIRPDPVATGKSAA